MDLDAAADELYGFSPEEFMARRTALVKQARSEGDKALAKEITALRKPTRTAWIVNLLARAEADQVTGLLELGHELQQAQQAMDGDALRRLSKDRRTRINGLAKRAIELGHDQGYAPPDGAVQEVSSTLQAALGDPGVAEQLQGGRLIQAAAYGGFGPDDLASALAASTSAKPERKLKAVPPLPPDAEEEEPAEPDEKAVAAAQQARAAAGDARAAADKAETAADEATTRADELADQVEALRNQLREAEEAECDARDEARAARKHLTELRRAAAAAEQAAARAEQSLT